MEVEVMFPATLVHPLGYQRQGVGSCVPKMSWNYSVKHAILKVLYRWITTNKTSNKTAKDSGLSEEGSFEELC